MKGALRIIYPPQCLCCGAGVSDDGALCPDCWRDATFVTGLACTRCGAPLPDDGTGGTESGDPATGGASLGDASLCDAGLCDDCLARDRPWRHGRAALVYGGTARHLVLALKHGDRPDLAPPLAAWLSRAAAPLVRPGTVVIPVPIHWRRLVRRKYNQSELLSRHLAARRGLTHLPEALRRVKNTPSQDHRSVADRFQNIAESIALNPRATGAVQGRAVLLIDDVMTSGATLAASAQALIDAGSGPVSVAVLARAVKSG